MREQSSFLIRRISNIIIFLLEQLVQDIVELSGNQAREYTLRKGARFRGQDHPKGTEQMLDLYSSLGIQALVMHMLELYSIRYLHIIFHLEDCSKIAFITKVASF